MATGVAVRPEDLQRLRGEVEKLKERMDFISPIVPLVHFMQDYYQKVECESTVQLLRLRNSRIISGPPADENEAGSATLETAKLLNMMTDAVLAINNLAKRANEDRGPTGHADPLSPRPQAKESAGDASAKLRKALSTGSMPDDEPRGYAARSAPESALGADRERSRDFLLQPTTEAPPANSASETLQELQARLRQRTSEELGSSRSIPVPVDTLRQESAEPLRMSAHAHHPAPARASTISSAYTPYPRPGIAEDDSAAEPLAEPGIGAPDRMDGLVLGKGSWATMYRQASGQRREALRLLCLSGIVTTRELADDLTVISEEHIDECVFIAKEMLATRPVEQWTRIPAEAKQVFETRLTALYHRKFGEQHGDKG